MQPGILLDWMRNEADRHHSMFGPEPSTHNLNALGGMIGNNSCGRHSITVGKPRKTLLISTY